MIPSEAILRFIDNQKRLLRKTYDHGWQNGVNSYQPDDNPPQEPTLPRLMAITGLTGAALLAVYRRYNYEPPVRPDPIRRTVALAPSFTSINRMGVELSTLTPGIIMSGSDEQALSTWIDSNGWRLNAGASVGWAGEQAGFAEAANADGQFLYGWMSVGDTRVCSDCELLSGFPAMPLDEWPTSPGAGDTECNAGCRCSWDTWGMPLPPSYVPDLSPDQSALIDNLSIQQAQALSDMMPDWQYLEG